jgi:hypothetical protein
MYAGFWRRNLKEGDYLGYLDLRWEVNIDMDVRKPTGRPWTGLVWIRTGTSGEYCNTLINFSVP